ncbi:TraB/GumN family protein [Marilutibacter alkalisoli]|uniref:TraB/GumN family protein n=1 Tax=Marilutibacter alkalisoli TaxID=2591633 RepID=UPI001422FEDD|nr:TraB/GumN family protein [Lysobacter alkalisoli]
MDDTVRDIDAVVVSGVLPGPGLWKVSNGGHVMWVLGTVSPLPRKMEWEAREVGQVMARAQELMWWPSVSFSADVGFFRGLALAPKVIGMRKNPDGARLEDVVPAEDYARWAVLKRKYVGRSNRIEGWQPIYAALELYGEAIDDTGLRQSGVIEPVLEKLARTHGVTQSRPVIKVVIEDPKQAIAELRKTRFDDLDCFRKTLDKLEGELGIMRERANAWAVGDLEELATLPDTNHYQACLDAVQATEVISRRSGGDLLARMREEWLGEAERALSNNDVTLALLSLRQLQGEDGLVAELRARGYTVEAPGEYEADPIADEAAAGGYEAGAASAD